jgi:hypothetical protein
MALFWTSYPPVRKQVVTPVCFEEVIILSREMLRAGGDCQYKSRFHLLISTDLKATVVLGDRALASALFDRGAGNGCTCGGG